MALLPSVCLQLIDRMQAMSVEFAAPKTVLAVPEAAKTLIETRLGSAGALCADDHQGGVMFPRFHPLR